jgi:hypothetical protein
MPAGTQTTTPAESRTASQTMPSSPVPEAPAAVPEIVVSSGYRNPRRNVAVGSKFPVTSKHVWGTALDLKVAGANATLWERLKSAGSNAGYTSICEIAADQKPCADPNIDHVHIQW